MQTTTATSTPTSEEDPFAALSVEELRACARLLAVSVAHHRDKYGTGVPLAASAARLRQLGENTRGRILNSASVAVMEEALAVRAWVDEDRVAVRSQNALVKPGDQRRQLRMNVVAPLQISDADGRGARSATLRGISWGGASIRCTDRAGGVGELLNLHLPDGSGGRIDVLAAVTWADGLEDARELGLRFLRLTPDDDERLQHVLEGLVPLADTQGRNAGLSLVPRLEIEYADPAELQATLESVSDQGFTLTVPDALRINESLLVCLASEYGDIELKLRARVRDQQRVGGPDYPMHRVELEFEYPTEQLRERVASAQREIDRLLAMTRPR